MVHQRFAPPEQPLQTPPGRGLSSAFCPRLWDTSELSGVSIISDNCPLHFFPSFLASILALCLGLLVPAWFCQAPRVLPTEPSMPWHQGQLAHECDRDYHKKDVLFLWVFRSVLCFGRGISALRCLPQWVESMLSGLWQLGSPVTTRDPRNNLPLECVSGSLLSRTVWGDEVWGVF